MADMELVAQLLVLHLPLEQLTLAAEAEAVLSFLMLFPYQQLLQLKLDQLAQLVPLLNLEEAEEKLILEIFTQSVAVAAEVGQATKDFLEVTVEAVVEVTEQDLAETGPFKHQVRD